jgi:hypothetical protein
VWEKGMHTKSVREARDRGAVNFVKRNAIVFDLPEGSIKGFWGYCRSYSDCDADLLHGLLLPLSLSFSLWFALIWGFVTPLLLLLPVRDWEETRQRFADRPVGDPAPRELRSERRDCCRPAAILRRENWELWEDECF